MLPDDLPAELRLSVMDVCGAPALTARVVGQYVAPGSSAARPGRRGDRWGRQVRLAVAGRGRPPAPARTIGVVPHQAEADLLAAAGIADVVAVADARDPVALSAAVAAAGGPADVTVVCVDVPGCEGGAILATADGGTVIFFSMATSFSAAALGAEGLAADVTMLVGNGYVPGHADFALSLLRDHAGVRALFERRLVRRCWDDDREHLLRGGYVHTPADPHAAALCLEDGEIVWTGDDDASVALRGRRRPDRRPRRPARHPGVRRRPRTPRPERLRRRRCRPHRRRQPG